MVHLYKTILMYTYVFSLSLPKSPPVILVTGSGFLGKSRPPARYWEKKCRQRPESGRFSNMTSLLPAPFPAAKACLSEVPWENQACCHIRDIFRVGSFAQLSPSHDQGATLELGVCLTLKLPQNPEHSKPTVTG